MFVGTGRHGHLGDHRRGLGNVGGQQVQARDVAVVRAPRTLAVEGNVLPPGRVAIGQPVADENEDVGLAAPEVIILVHTLKEQYEALCARAGQASELLPLANAVLALCRAPKSRLADDFLTMLRQQRTQQGLHLEVPDCALDKHTLKGKHKGRGWQHFIDESTQLANETPAIPNIYKERADKLRLTWVSEERSKAGSIDTRKAQAEAGKMGGKKKSKGWPAGGGDELPFDDDAG